MEELASLVVEKKDKFRKYLGEASKAEGKALEYSELMKSEVNNVFDGIVASVETQRNEALQSVSQGVKEIWSQKEMVEVSLAQLDSFTQFADHTHKCTANTSYVAMAIQCIKLMERLKNANGDEDTLDYKIMHLGLRCSEGPLHVPLEKVFTLSKRLSINFSPVPLSHIGKSCATTIVVSLMVGEFPVVYHPILHEKCELVVEASVTSSPPVVSLVQSRELSWEITDFPNSWGLYKLVAKCRLLKGNSVKILATEEATYYLNTLA